MSDILFGSSLELADEILDGRFCRDRAAETRRLADNTSVDEAKILMEIAERYERLAELANAANAKKTAVLPGA